jgi:hypothetical protein
MAINNYQFPSKYIVEEQYFTKEKFLRGDVRYEDFLMVKGGKIRNYDDITEVGKDFYAASSITLSENKSPFYEWIAGQPGGVVDLKTNFARWRVYGKPDRRAISIGNPNGDNQYLGEGGGVFRINVDVNWFNAGELIAPEENPRAILRILSDWRPVSGGYQYDVELLESDAYVPPQYFNSGKYWLRALGAPTSYLSSETAGTFNFGVGFSYLEFEVPLTTVLKEMSIDEETHLRQGNLNVSMCDVTDKVIEQNITNLMELEFDQAIRSEKEFYMTWGSLTKDKVDLKSGKGLTTSPGLFAFLEHGNVFQYNPWVNSIDMIVDIINTFWYDRVQTNKRKLILYTGEAGLKLWHDWINEKYGQTVTIQDVNFILGSTKAFDPDKQGKSLNNYQFTEYKIQPFGSVTVAHWPMLDNTIVHSAPMPGSRYTLKSHEFIAMDYGLGEANVKMFTRSDKYNRLVIPGFWSPAGAVGEKNPVAQWKTVGDASLGYAYKVHHRESFGMGVMDVNKILRFVPAVR